MGFMDDLEGASCKDAYIKENQNLKEIIEAAKQITSGLEISYILKNVQLMLFAKFNPEFLAFVLKKDIDDYTPIYHLFKGASQDNFALKFESIELLTKFFENQEFNQISFDQFKESFKDNIVIEEIGRDKPEFIIPVRSNKAMLGIILLGNKRDKKPYALEEIRLCGDIINFASISIENANLYREAIVDRMTKLYSHHQFHENLTKYINIGHRYGNKFSLIMFDIDHFKSFNDKYGHLQGDIIIKEIAKILLNSIRNVDFAARYGGEEFMVLMPEKSINSAVKLAERIRKNIEVFDFPGDKVPLKVTISVGVIEFNPKFVKYNEDIIENLDQALYRSKQHGRNKVTVGEYK